MDDTLVLERMIQPANGGLSPELAQQILSWNFTESDRRRIDGLLEQSRTGALSQDDSEKLDWYLLVDHFVSILQSKARRSLKEARG